MMNFFSRLWLLFLVGLNFGCSMIRESVCENGAETQAASEGLAPEKSEESGEDTLEQFHYVYSRAKYLTDASRVSTATSKTLHLCAYLVTSRRAFASVDHLLRAAKEDETLAEMEMLYPYYTSTEVLSAEVRRSRREDSERWRELGFHLLPSSLGDLDKVMLGIDHLVHEMIPTLSMLLYGGEISRPETEIAALSANAVSVSVESLTDRARSSYFNELNLNNASSARPQYFAEVLKNSGMKNPPESILRLPIEDLAEYPCPEY